MYMSRLYSLTIVLWSSKANCRPSVSEKGTIITEAASSPAFGIPRARPAKSMPAEARRGSRLGSENRWTCCRLVTSKPVSSLTSRNAAVSALSPTLTKPPGIANWCTCGWQVNHVRTKTRSIHQMCLANLPTHARFLLACRGRYMLIVLTPSGGWRLCTRIMPSWPLGVHDSIMTSTLKDGVHRQ